MRAPANLDLDETPAGSYGLEVFDAALGVLNHISDRDARREILDRLEQQDVDVDELAVEMDLPAGIRDGLRRLAAFGDRKSMVWVFGGAEVVDLHVEAPYGRVDYNGSIFAIRECGRIHFVFVDENQYSRDLGWADRAVPMRAIITLVEEVLRNGAHADCDWRDTRLGQQPDLDILVSSRVYPQLGAWFDQQIAEWRARHRRSTEVCP